MSARLEERRRRMQTFAKAGEQVASLFAVTRFNCGSLSARAQRADREAIHLIRSIDEWFATANAAAPGEEPLCLTCTGNTVLAVPVAFVILLPFAAASGDALIGAFCAECFMRAHGDEDQLKMMAVAQWRSWGLSLREGAEGHG